MKSHLLEADYEAYTRVVRQVVQRHVLPSLDLLDEDRLVDCETWRGAGRLGRSIWL